MRTLTGAVAAAVAGSNVPLVVFVEMDFSSGFLRVTNAPYDIQWDSQTWVGVGQLGSIDALSETSGLEANGLSFQISGVAQANIAAVLGTEYQGRSCKLWIAALDSNHQVLADPIGPFSYRMDTMDIELGQTATIRVNAESRIVDWETPVAGRYTNEEQQRLYPGDFGLEFVPQMAEKQIRWGY